MLQFDYGTTTYTEERIPNSQPPYTCVSGQLFV